MSYMALRGGWCNIVVLNVHAPSEENSDDSKDSIYEKLEQVFNHFPTYHMKILLEILIKNWGEDIFKPTVGNKSLQQGSKDNGIRIVNFATSKSGC
jgi:hypothetical protein